MFKQFFLDKKGVVFDLDGTVIESSDLWNKAFEEVASNLDIEWKGKNFISGKDIPVVWSDYLNFVGRSPGVSMEQLVRQTKSEFLKFVETEGVEVKEGFWHFSHVLREEKKFKLGLVTNTDRDVGSRVVEKVGIGNSFNTIIYGDDVKKKKPHPEIYKLASNNMELKPEELLVFEDSPEGAKSADKAKMDVIVIWDWHRFSEKDFPSNVLAYVEDFTKFPGNLDKTRKEFLLEKYSASEENS